MNDEKIIKLQHFFTVDMKIKNEMYDIAPPSSEQYLDEDSLTKYTDILSDSLTYIFIELKSVAVDIFGSHSKVYERICHLEQVIKSNFYNCGLNINKLQLFYKNFISNMDSDFINSVKKECVRYTFSSTNSINMATSINEILHLIHSFIVNNDDILKSIPILNEKNNNYSYPIRLRGVNAPIFEQLFTMFPKDLDCGWTDMVIINEKKLIMIVRDRGHALSIEISLNNDIARIEYFIPKLCNRSMINELPGVNKVNENSVGATGVIEIKVSDLPVVLFDFISKVPMDKDMIYGITKNI